MSDELPPPQNPAPGDDWRFPQVQPPPQALLGWTPEPALPEEAAAPPYAPEAVAEPTVEAGPDWRSPLVPTPAPSAGVMPVPRRHQAAGPPVSPIRALAGAAVAVAGILLGIGALLWATDAPKGSPALQEAQAQTSQLSASARPAPSATPSSIEVTVAPSPTRTQAALAAPAAPKLALTVLNNSNRTGLAKRAAARYAAAGWPITLTGSFRGRVSETTAYYAPGQRASALALQRSFPAILRVRPRFAGLPGSGLTVVLTRTYPA